MRLVLTFPWKENSIICDVHESGNVTIYDSYKITRRKHMKEILERVNQHRDGNTSIWYQLCEWKTHNLLYELNIERSRTKDYDINDDISIWEKIGFVLLSVFYIKF